MIKTYPKKILLLIAVAILVVTGCSRSANNPQVSNNSTISTKSQIPQEPTRRAEVFGKVQKILGNEVTILGAEGQGNNQFNEEPLNQHDRDKRRAEMQNLSPEERQSQRGELNFSGETKVVIIPVGTPITSSSRINGEEMISELSWVDITPGKVFKIWIEGEEDDDVQIAEYVKLLPNF